MRPNSLSVLNEDRFFDPQPSVRDVARLLYESVADLPLVCPHGHVDPAILADNAPFLEPTSLLLSPDHYVLRMLYSQGISMQSLGITGHSSAIPERDPRKSWQLFAENYFLFRGTPTRAWFDYELSEVFGITVPLDGKNGPKIYDEIAEKLRSPEFLPRALFERFKIEVLATTDKATDLLAHHDAIRHSGWRGRVIPTFRPDALFAIASQGWKAEVETLARVSEIPIHDFESYLNAIRDRRSFFKSMGATATDHGVESATTGRLPGNSLSALFAKAFAGECSMADQARFEAHMLMEMAGMSVDDGLVMQIHAGALRNHNSDLHASFGPDRGGDIPVASEFTRNLRPLLNEFGSVPGFTLVLFTLDESTYSRELAPLAGHYPALRLGPPWWFHDSMQGMIRFRESMTETAGIYNTAGFNDDTRAFCSIPARHDLSRRMDSNFLARLVSTHVIGESEALEMARSLTYDLPRKTYRLDSTPEAGSHD
ncbi:MAG: glucuronate isomerase [Gemmatimonadaceae bacterium]|nr:glucuronate isomerase [Gemmatimonadaceae bacterium]